MLLHRTTKAELSLVVSSILQVNVTVHRDRLILQGLYAIMSVRTDTECVPVSIAIDANGVSRGASFCSLCLSQS